MQTTETPRGNQEVGTGVREDKYLLKGRREWVGFDTAQKSTELIKGHARTQWVNECCVETF